ncbi:hypothetical protein GCM10023086_21460 [Streptomyces venetus]|uniref:Uncharacterized protein n=1 Tax=Streptomyces venetus TaxID=1701086 RepID=A0ABP8FI54_9ACTN
MRITLEVTGPDGTASAGGGGELREWLRGDPELRHRVGRSHVEPPPPGAMGALDDIIPLLLEPGGLTVTLAAAVVAWLQTRRGSQTVTITKPDGTQVVVTSEGVRGLTPETSGDLAQRVAEALQAPSQEPQQPQQSQQQRQQPQHSDRPDQAESA